MQQQVVEFKVWLERFLLQTRVELNMETAIASLIEQDNYTIVAVSSEMEGVFKAKQVFPLQDTFCRAVYDSHKCVTYDHIATIDGMLQHPVYQAVKLESYIAAPIFDANSDVVGTINFTSLLPHKPCFTAQEREMVQQLAYQVSQQLNLYTTLATQ